MIIPFYPITDQFKESFCVMDIDKINLILDIDKKFCKVSKTEFIETLSKVFNYLKNLGEDTFIDYKAKCKSNDCCNCNKEVIVFVSKNSHHYIAFMVEDHEEHIYRISECYNYDFNSSKLNTRLVLQDFVNPSKVEQSIDIDCEEIIKELYPTEDYIPSFNEFSFWAVKTKRILYKNRIYHKEINLLINFFESEFSLLEKIPSIENAIGEFEKLNKQDESKVILWLIKYEKLKHDLLLFYMNNELEPLKGGKFSITDNNKYYIDISKLAIVFVFYEKYLSLFSPINEKFDFDTYSLKYQWTPMENRLKELNLIKSPDDYSHDEYVVDMDKLNEYYISNSKP
jgi:hypothetical protein